jgi:segregation and condensation protein B
MSPVFSYSSLLLYVSHDILLFAMEQKVSNAQLPAQLSDRQLSMAVESLLFVAGRPLERAELRKLLGVNEQSLAAALEVLSVDLEQHKRGIRLQCCGEQVQLVTAPEHARYIAALLGLPMTAKLTSAALETLSVIAYRQPLTRSQIEAVRGVNSDRALTSLLQHGLVAEAGRAQTVGHPTLFATTPEFLQQFGLTSLQELPGVSLADQSAPSAQEGMP